MKSFPNLAFAPQRLCRGHWQALVASDVRVLSRACKLAVLLIVAQRLGRGAYLRTKTTGPSMLLFEAEITGDARKARCGKCCHRCGKAVAALVMQNQGQLDASGSALFVKFITRPIQAEADRARCD